MMSSKSLVAKRSPKSTSVGRGRAERGGFANAYKHRLKQFVTSQIEFDLAVRAGSGESVEGMSGSVWMSQA
jgi:hypothetical protein